MASTDADRRYSKPLAVLGNMYERGAAILLAGRAIQLLNSFGWSIVLIKRFGLNMVGTFAVGVVAVTVLSTVSPLGLPSFLPRVRQPHARLCFAGITLQLAALPAIVGALLVYAKLFAENSSEERIIFLVALSGFAIGCSNTGLMLSIMARRFYPATVAPLFETLAILAAGLSAASPETVAGYMLLSRFAGALLIWAGMRASPMSRRRLTCVLRRSISYLAPDMIATLSEQIAPLILQMLTTRAELGLFRLCQQMLNASDTPGWSYVQSKYPELVRCNERVFASVQRAVTRLAMLASILCAAGSSVLAIWVYHLPAIVPMMCLLSASLFWRYKNNLFDQGFRASGQVATSTVLGTLKLFLGGITFYFLIRWQGVWGAVLALTMLSIAAGLVYERVYGRPAILVRATS
jgi:O-antigen/teichoic acid export membrane protein